jgi:hypothetical protein
MSDLGRAVAQPLARLILPASPSARATSSRLVDAESKRVALVIGVRVRLDDLEPLLAALPAIEARCAARILRELRALVREPGR